MLKSIVDRMHRFNNNIISVKKNNLEIESGAVIVRPNGSIALNLQNHEVKKELLDQLNRLSSIKTDN